MQSDVADELLEFLLRRGLVLVGPDLHEHADFSTGVDVGGE